MINTKRIWLFRILVLGAAAMIITSFLLPWWTCDICEIALMNAMTMHPYGLEHKLGEYTTWVEDALPPAWLTTVAYIYFVIVIGALLVSIFLRQPVGGLLLGAVGLAYLGFSLIAFGYAIYSMSQFGISPTGYSYVDETQGIPWHTGIISTILPGFYIAVAAAVVTIILSFIRNKITGETAVFWKKSKTAAMSL